jgi:hypothetical protein
MFVSVTWICVGFGLIAFSLREWDLPLSPSYDWIADSEPVVSMSARVFGGAFVYWGLVLLLTPKPTADILIAAVVGVIPGLMTGLLINHFVLPKGTLDDRCAAWIGMGLVPGVILICLAVLRKGRRNPNSM